MQSKSPLVLILCDDIFFLPRIEDAATALGFRYRVIEKGAQLGLQGDSVLREIPLTEPLQGPDAALIRHLVDERPALIIVDTAHQTIPWKKWIGVIKTSAATLRIPIIAFGAHVLRESLADAKEAGADITISRGQLQASIGDLLTEWSRFPDQDAIFSICAEELSDEGKQGIQLIHKGEYYKAHEILELAWQNSIGAEAYLIRSLLQVSVIYLHIQRSNLRGAMKMLLRVKEWLDPLPSRCQGIDVEALRKNLDELRAALDESGLGGSGDGLNRFLIPILMVMMED